MINTPTGCRYITGDPLKDGAWCNQPAHGSYCEDHHKLCYCRVVEKSKPNVGKMGNGIKITVHVEAVW